jgi:hypothetical protein
LSILLFFFPTWVVVMLTTHRCSYLIRSQQVNIIGWQSAKFLRCYSCTKYRVHFGSAIIMGRRDYL